MFTRQVAVLISRPPDEVFAFVADARNRPVWDKSVDSEELMSPEPIRVGSGTWAEFSVTGRPRGLLRLFQPMIARNTQANLDRAFPRLKEALEPRA